MIGESMMLIIVAAVALVALLICFKLKSDIKKIKLAIEGEASLRQKQDWKLYNYMKSNYNVLAGKKLPVEDKIKKTEELL